MRKNNIISAFVALMLVVTSVSAQNNTNSPYTRFGFGELSDANATDSKAMGGIGVASRSKTSINTINPASYSTVDTMSFMFDVGVGGLYSRFTDPTGTKNSLNSNLEYVTMQFPLAKNMGFSAGLLPYSFSGYSFFNEDSIAITNNSTNPDYVHYSRIYSGAGGISQVYAGLGYKLFDKISLGVNAYYMFGQSMNIRYLSFIESSVNGISALNSVTEYNSIDVKNFRFRYGLQYFETINKKHSFTLGGVFENQAAMNGSFSKIIINNGSDTIHYDNKFETPLSWSAGLNYKYDQKLMVGVDYSMQNWGSALFFGKTDSLQNRSKLAVGAEYIPDIRGRKYSDRIRYRAGFNVSDSYYKVNGNAPAKNFGISFGVGLPLRNSATVVNASFEYGKVGASSMLREDYLKFTFSAAFNEMWFFKRKL